LDTRLSSAHVGSFAGIMAMKRRECHIAPIHILDANTGTYNIEVLDKYFNDEIELLEPIMNGAGIIYVVDGSKPYGEEYEAEMEILRWTGQPSMALINHIDASDYSEEWKRALGQYFKMVRTFNPMQTNMGQHVSILESMAQLKEEWIAPIKASIKLFEQYQEQMLERSAALLARLVYESVATVVKLTFKTEEASIEDKDKIERQYKNRLRDLEVTMQKNIEKVWNHDHTQKCQQQTKGKEQGKYL